MLPRLWAGRDGGTTPLHYDEKENLLAQIRGRKHVLLFPRSETFNLYPYPPHHTLDNYSMVDVEDAAASDAYPALKDARGVATTLDAGDVLYIPAGYWHYVQQLDADADDSVSVNYWFDTRLLAAKTRPRDSLPDRPLSDRRFFAWRILESALPKLLGDGDDWGRCLTAWARAGAAEAAMGNPATRRTLEKLEAELAGLLGDPAHVAPLLIDLAKDGRLWPGAARHRDGPLEANAETGVHTPAEKVPPALLFPTCAPPPGRRG